MNEDNGGGLLDWVEPDTDNGLGTDPNDAEKGADRYAATVGDDAAPYFARLDQLGLSRDDYRD